MLRLFKQYYPIRNIFFFLGEGVFIYLSVVLAALFLLGGPALHGGQTIYLKLFLFTVVCQACLYFNDLYDLKESGELKELAIRLAQSLGVAAILLAFIYMAFPETIIGSGVFTVACAILIVLIVCWRFCYSWVLDRGWFNQKVLLLGSGDLVKKIRKEIKARKDCGYSLGVEVPESIDDVDLSCPAGVPTICRGGFEGLCELSHGLGIRKIVVGFREKRNRFPTQELLRCRVEGIEVIDGNSFYEMLTGKILVESINPSWLIFSGGFQKSKTRRIVKRLTDLLMAVSAIALLSPLLLLTAVLIRLDSPGPVFYVQERVGERRRIYRMYKFRSMVKDAEAMSGPVWAREKDPRITRVGRVMRRLRIDELPQLWNVLKGEMSFVPNGKCSFGSWKRPCRIIASASRSSPELQVGPK